MSISYKFQPLFELLDDRFNEKYEKIRYVILVGGRGSGKSHALSAWINQASYKDGWGILFARYTMTSAETSIIPEFRSMCEKINNESDFEFKRTQVINKYSECVIDYKGLKPTSNQSTGALKSVANKNIFILEEAEDCPSFPLFDKVDNSIRTINHKNLVILCLNQGHVNHWIYKEFIQDKRDDTLVIETTYLDNLKFLDQSFINKAERIKERDLKRYNHIYLNEWQRDTEGALFKDCDISPYRISMEDFKELDIVETIVSYDPAVTDYEKPSNERTKETGNEPDKDGITICARDRKGHYYVVREHGMHGTRSQVVETLVRLYYHWNCNWLVIEKNNGGDYIPALVKTVKGEGLQDGQHVRIKMVHASRGKALRAQPIQSLYENGEVSHVGYLPELEYEMTNWIPDSGMPSPNALDSSVWGLTHLSGNDFKMEKRAAIGLY